MDLSNLKPARGSKHSKKRIGRGHGTGQGTQAGRGQLSSVPVTQSFGTQRAPEQLNPASQGTSRHELAMIAVSRYERLN